ncbi:glycosyltransferase [Cytobacillus luteolus]|nr:glycosyltransferase [Cytobacillus luteolus]
MRRMNLIKVSIIIPVYNNEKFLDKCLSSVINQTLKDIEIIIINDGSTDGSLLKLKEYESQNSNIILLNQKNAGQASAINRALEIACGEYIGFVDADDFVDHHMFETLYQEVKCNNLDLIICNWTKVDTNGKVLSYNDHDKYDNKILGRDEVIQEFLLNDKELVEGFSWNKLIKRTLFMDYNIRYPNIRYEDIPTIFKVLTKVNKCKYINKKLYYYVQHGASITNTKNVNNIIGFIAAVELLYDIIVEEKLESECMEAYYIYRSKCLIAEYILTIDVVNHSSVLRTTFDTIFQSIKMNQLLKPPIQIKLIIQLFLYKIRLLPQLMLTYQKCKSLYNKYLLHS